MNHSGAASAIAPGEQSRAPAEPAALALRMGQLLMDNGAETERVAQTLRSVGAGLGCAWNGVSVHYGALFVGEPTPQGSRTELRAVRPRAVNMSLIAHLSRLTHRVGRGELSAEALGEVLREFESAPRHYPPWLTTIAVGLACAAFSRLLQGDGAAFGVTFAASTLTMWARHRWEAYAPNRLIFVGASACLAGCIVGALQSLFVLSRTPAAAMVACVLMLVPGVPAINAAQDLIKGHLSVAVARATECALIILASTLGLLLGLRLAQVPL